MRQYRPRRAMRALPQQCDPITTPAWNDDGSDYNAVDQEKLAELQDRSSRETSGHARHLTTDARACGTSCGRSVDALAVPAD